MLTISDQAREYILAKSGSVYLFENGRARMCCGNIDFGPSVYLGQPPDDKDYKVEEINGITVFVPKRFYAPNPLTIDIGNFLGLKTLHIEGWKLI